MFSLQLSAEKKHHESEKQQMQKDIEQLKRALNDLHNQPRESNNQVGFLLTSTPPVGGAQSINFWLKF